VSRGYKYNRKYARAYERRLREKGLVLTKVQLPKEIRDKLHEIAVSNGQTIGQYLTELIIEHTPDITDSAGHAY
jgi:hypothetical protein